MPVLGEKKEDEKNRAKGGVKERWGEVLFGFSVKLLCEGLPPAKQPKCLLLREKWWEKQ